MIYITLLCFVISSTKLSTVNAVWHAYKEDKVPDAKYNCPAHGTQEYLEENKLQTKAVSDENKKRWKLWPDVVSTDDIAGGETMYGFEVGMEAIWKNQHPEDCSKAKFLFSGGFESGFASEFHVVGSGLALALELGRVYMMIPDAMQSGIATKMDSANRWQVDNPHCRKQNNTNLDCFFEPWSSCTFEDAIKGTSLKNLRGKGLLVPYNEINKDRAKYESLRTVIAHLSPEVQDFIPSQLRKLVECSPFSPNKYRYWWRSISVAYLLRPNPATLQLFQLHRRDREQMFDREKEKCVSVYIRRGDKHLEMPLIMNETVFFEGAKGLWDNIPNHDQQKRPVMFVGSEDPKVIDSAIAWGHDNNWKILYSNLFDRKKVSTHLNSDMQMKLKSQNKFVHHEWEYFSMILNLDSHIQCSAFVCTMRSNYCRLIDELRATVGGKVNRQYADYTLQPPAVDSPKSSIDWR